MLKKLKKCKSLRELYEVIPEGFYEKSSFVLITAMIMMIIFETIRRYAVMFMGMKLDYKMPEYFYGVGYVMIAFVAFTVCIKLAGLGVKKYFRDNPYDILLLIMLVLAFVSAVNAVNREQAFMGDWFRQSGFRTYLIYGAAYICGKNILYKKNTETVNKMKFIIYTMLGVSCTFQNTMVLLRYHIGRGSDRGAFMNTNHTGYYMVICIFAITAMIGLASEVTKRTMTGNIVRIIGMLLYIVNIYCLIINNTFGAYVAVMLGLIFMLVISLLKRRRLKLYVPVYIVVFLLVSLITDYHTGIISVNFGITTGDIHKIADGTEDADNAGNGRWWIWKDAVGLIYREPVIGCGPDCFSEVSRSTVTGDETDTQNLITPHNEYLQYAGEIGIPAALCYVAALVMIFIYKLRHMCRQEMSVIYDGTIVFAYCISAFFGVIMFYTAIFYFIFLGIVSNNRVKELHKV